jgi:hypothetical protein
VSGIGELLSELRERRGLLEALRETQLEQRQEMRQCLADTKQLFAQLNQQLTTVLAGIQAIADRLDDRPGGNG